MVTMKKNFTIVLSILTFCKLKYQAKCRESFILFCKRKNYYTTDKHRKGAAIKRDRTDKTEREEREREMAGNKVRQN